MNSGLKETLFGGFVRSTVWSGPKQKVRHHHVRRCSLAAKEWSGVLP